MLRLNTSRQAGTSSEPDPFARITLQFMRETGFQGRIREDGAILVYHGTSARNAASILKGGAFRGFPWFALDPGTARRFAQQAPGRPEVLELALDPGAVVPTCGYLSARLEGLRRWPGDVWAYEAPEAAQEDTSAGGASLRSAAKAAEGNGMPLARTEAFRLWFGHSRVVDQNGDPLRLFHGTKEAFNQFDPSRSRDGGLHFGTADQANMRVSGPGKRLIPVFLKVENPRRSKDTGGNWHSRIASAKAAGHDGIVYLNRYEGFPLERVDELERKGLMDRLDSLSDREFRKLVPEAQDSWIVFSEAQVKLALGNGGDSLISAGGSAEGSAEAGERP
jgi:hypothetical protein